MIGFWCLRCAPAQGKKIMLAEKLRADLKTACPWALMRHLAQRPHCIVALMDDPSCDPNLETQVAKSQDAIFDPDGAVTAKLLH